MSRAPLRQFPQHLRRKVNLRPAMLRALPFLRRDVRVRVSGLPPPGPLSRALGSSGDYSAVADGKETATRYRAKIRAPGQRKLRALVRGKADVLRTPAQVYRLRHLAVKAGIYPRSVLFLPPDVAPFGGRELKQPPRDPYAEGASADTVERASADCLHVILRTYGFT